MKNKNIICLLGAISISACSMVAMAESSHSPTTKKTASVKTGISKPSTPSAKKSSGKSKPSASKSKTSTTQKKSSSHVSSSSSNAGGTYRKMGDFITCRSGAVCNFNYSSEDSETVTTKTESSSDDVVKTVGSQDAKGDTSSH